MKVKDIIQLISYGTRWRLIGASSGKKLAHSGSSDRMKDKYMECEVTDSPIFTAFETIENTITKTVDYAHPIIFVWVSGM